MYKWELDVGLQPLFDVGSAYIVFFDGGNPDDLETENKKNNHIWQENRYEKATAKREKKSQI